MPMITLWSPHLIEENGNLEDYKARFKTLSSKSRGHSNTIN